MKKIMIERKQKSIYGTKEWVDRILANPNLTEEDYKRFIRDLHKTKRFMAKNLLQWALKKRQSDKWITSV